MPCPASAQLSATSLLGLVKSRSEGVEEGGGHVHSEAVLSGAGEPAHVCPAGLTDDEVSPLQAVPALRRHQAALGVSPDHAVTALVSLNVTGQPGRVPGLEHDGAQPPRDGGGGPLQGPGDAGGERFVTDNVQLGGHQDLLSRGLGSALVHLGG